MTDPTSQPNHDRTVNAGGGTYVEGNVDTDGGDFTGRDQTVHGDYVRGDRLDGDKITVGDIRAENGAIAIGSSARAEYHQHNHYLSPSIGAPFQAPSLPVHFVPRPEMTDALKAWFLADQATPGVLAISAIHGLGGIGKSVLAAALARNPEIQERFSDGVLWTTLGQEPDLLSLLSGWIRALGDYGFRPTTVEVASTHLRTLLHNKAVLLVVDDAWESEHVLPLKAGGAQCRMLITTRRIDVTDQVGADLYQMDVMTEAQSLDLLVARSRQAPNEVNTETVLRLAKTVGYLPLALELAAARVTRGVTWSALREALEEEVARLEILEGPRARQRGLELKACFNLSLSALRDEDEAAWRSFVLLGVLPEDVVMAAPMAATLWNVDRSEASELLELLWNDALLLSGTPIRIGQKEWPGYRTHDLLRDMARFLLVRATPGGLGLTLEQAHACVLKSYRAQVQEELWCTLPEDGYIHAYLIWHMERAGQADEIHNLLQETTVDGVNGWHQARERLGQLSGYLEDLRRASTIAAQSGMLSLQIRYALMESTMHALAQKVPAELFTEMLKNADNDESRRRIWVWALDHIRQLPRVYEKADALYDMAPYLPTSDLSEALDIALGIADENERGLLGLARFLPADLMAKAFAYLPSLTSGGTQFWFFETVAPVVPGSCWLLPWTLPVRYKTAVAVQLP